MKFLRAMLPGNTQLLPGGVWLTDRPEIPEQIWDVLYGPSNPRPGRGLVEAEGWRGRYRVIRDFQTGQAHVETLAGRPAPDPALIAPGWFLRGCGRPEAAAAAPLAPAPRAPLHGDDSLQRAHRARRRHLLACADGLDVAGRAPEADSTVSRALVQRNVERALEVLATEDEELTAERQRQAHLVTRCLEDLRKPGDPGCESATSRALRAMAATLADLEGARQRADLVRKARIIVPALGALFLAAGGLAGLGISLAEPVMIAAGLVGAGMATLPPLLLWLLAQRRSASLDREIKTLWERAAELLFRARLVLEDGPMDAAFLEAAAERVARRDLLQRVRENLHGVLAMTVRGALPPGETRKTAGAPEASGRRGLQQLRAALADLGRTYEDEGRRVEREAELRGARRGAAAALRLEADALRRESERLERCARARSFLADRLQSIQEPEAASTLRAYLDGVQREARRWPTALPLQLVPADPGLLRGLLAEILAGAPSQTVVVGLDPAVHGSAALLLGRLPPDLRPRVRIVPARSAASRALRPEVAAAS